MQNKTSAIASLCIWGTVAAALTALLVILSAGGHARLNGWLKRSQDVPGDARTLAAYDEEAPGLQTVSLRWHAGQVTVAPSSDGRLHVRQTSRWDEEPMEYSLSGDTLTIRQKARAAWFLFFLSPRQSNLTVELPARRYAEFALEITSGSASVKDIGADTLRLLMTSGDIDAAGLTAGELTLRTTSGNLNADAQADSLSTETTSGDLRVTGSFGALSSRVTSGKLAVESAEAPQSMDLRITSGDVSVSIPDNDGFTLEGTKTSGGLSSDFDLLSPLGGKDRYVYGKGAGTGRVYTYKITSGSFRLGRLTP